MLPPVIHYAAEEMAMEDYIKKMLFGDEITVTFYIDSEQPAAVANAIRRRVPDIEMNGYNWDALLVCYLEEKHPDLLTDFDSDPEAEMYTAMYPDTPENRKRADALCALLETLCEDEEILSEFAAEYADEIAWD